MEGRLAVHVAALPLESLALVMRPLQRLELELVAESDQPSGWAQALGGWWPLLVLKGARLVESPVA